MKRIFIHGMHRSSTSLISQFLQRSGIFLGENLLGPHKDNLDGYFEHADLVKLHNEIIQDNKRNIFNMPHIADYPEDSKRKLKIIDNNLQSSNTNAAPFGYKDPRSCLFIKAIDRVFPNSCHLMIFRNYTQVVDSLIRRSTDRELRFNPWLASKAWHSYNSQLIQFRKENRGKTLIVNDAFVIENSCNFINLVNRKFDISLKPISIKDIYKPKLTKRSGEPSLKTKLALFPYKAKLSQLESQLYSESSKDYKSLDNS